MLGRANAMRGKQTRELPLIPEAWHDRAGSIGAVMNRDPGNQRLHESAVSPNEPPHLDQYLARYQDYTSLREWELVTGGLHKEEVPARRHHLGEYRQVTEQNLGPQYGASSASASSPSRAAKKGEERPHADLLVVHTDTPQKELLPHPPRLPFPPAAPEFPAELSSAPSVGAPPPLHEVPIGSARHFQPAAPTSASSTPRHDFVAGSFQGHGTAYQTSPRQQRRKDHSASSGFGPVEARVPPDVSPQIRTIHQHDTGRLNGIDGTGLSARAKIVDKERSHYPSAKDMRPARRINLESKKRLNELLKLPEARIDAADSHPSRRFQAVPSQNLRVV